MPHPVYSTAFYKQIRACQSDTDSLMQLSERLAFMTFHAFHLKEEQCPFGIPIDCRLSGCQVPPKPLSDIRRDITFMPYKPERNICCTQTNDESRG